MLVFRGVSTTKNNLQKTLSIKVIKIQRHRPQGRQGGSAWDDRMKANTAWLHLSQGTNAFD